MEQGITHITSCCAIILAAGQSARMGSPKQLLDYHGKTLLQNAIDAAKGANVQTIIVILGANAEKILPHLDINGVCIAENKDWQSGMASSIITAIDAIERIDPSADAVLLMVCDQPFINSSLLNELIAARQRSGKLIAASRYGNTLGVPALFHKNLFNELANLKGDQGARKIIQLYRDSVEIIDFPEGNIDIDTKDEYEKLV
ncbi:MAG TPA: nucleotidyltransferase family protein [Mucilaginibacter sp.]|jgi:molybdenum cofactor cytidylyltransferase|nr:nucleotidyltransferase family protein [Mucilaginibacter sp.]